MNGLSRASMRAFAAWALMRDPAPDILKMGLPGTGYVDNTTWRAGSG
ncbi:MAG: hypothetical protein A4E38_00904 [Methanoregulaceae archaeon PtaB.Bin108]|nr:MAG: hypothetical protein A4E38_00904 [Methanoregulaceae archaeon PtaB.Bin108]